MVPECTSVLTRLFWLIVLRSCHFTVTPSPGTGPPTSPLSLPPTTPAILQHLRHSYTSSQRTPTAARPLVWHRRLGRPPGHRLWSHADGLSDGFQSPTSPTLTRHKSHLRGWYHPRWSARDPQHLSATSHPCYLGKNIDTSLVALKTSCKKEQT